MKKFADPKIPKGDYIKRLDAIYDVCYILTQISVSWQMYHLCRNLLMRCYVVKLSFYDEFDK